MKEFIELIETKNLKRNVINIQIVVDCENDNEFKRQNLLLNIGKIIEWLEFSNNTNAMHDFVFGIAFWDSNEEINGNMFFNKLKNLSGNIEVQRLECGESFVIHNKHCAINGWTDSVFGDCGEIRE